MQRILPPLISSRCYWSKKITSERAMHWKYTCSTHTRMEEEDAIMQEEVDMAKDDEGQVQCVLWFLRI